jgi:multicomponent Na+:H+ antiporter subunit D
VSAAAAILLGAGSALRPLPAGRLLRLGVRALRRLHSGHLGDYLAWLAVGVAVLCAALAAQA